MIVSKINPIETPKKSAFVGYFWSGKHKRTVKGVNLITLYYTLMSTSIHIPSTFAFTTNGRGKTKNELIFRWDSASKFEQW